jgi:RNA polymerase sigma-70 factor (ECF subfamily)
MQASFKRGAAQEDQPSFTEVYRAHASFIWRVVQRLGVPAADAEDVSQEVFVVVHRKLSGFARQSTLRTWLYGIAYRCASEYRRRAHVRKEVATESPDLGAEEAPQLEFLDKVRARQALDRMLSELDADKRAVFVFYEIEELDMNEIATIMQCPVQTAYSRLRSARSHVQAAAGRLAAKEQG